MRKIFRDVQLGAYESVPILRSGVGDHAMAVRRGVVRVDKTIDAGTVLIHEIDEVIPRDLVVLVRSNRRDAIVLRVTIVRTDKPRIDREKQSAGDQKPSHRPSMRLTIPVFSGLRHVVTPTIRQSRFGG